MSREGYGRIVGRAGVGLRKRRLLREPLCRHCKAKGIITAATSPDHIVPLHKGGLDVDTNVQSLCGPCHETKTRIDMGHREKATIGADGWPIG